MRLKLNQLINEIRGYYVTDKKVVLVFDYNDCLQSTRDYGDRDVARDLPLEAIIDIITNTYNELNDMNNAKKLYIFNCYLDNISEENLYYKIDAMKPTSYGASGIFELRIFVLDDVLITNKINDMKSPYKEIFSDIKESIHPYWFHMNLILRQLNDKFHDFFYKMYNNNEDDLKWHFIDMVEYRKIILEEMQSHQLFNSIIDDFQFEISDSNKTMIINNIITGFEFKLVQYSETKHYCDCE